jgi:hypothetical protein
MNESEFLDQDELIIITGYKHIASQREWLDKNGWNYVINGAGRPIVGRWYTRMRLSGIKPTATGMQSTRQPDFSVFK